MELEENKYYVNPWKVALSFAIVALAIMLVFYFTLGSYKWPPLWQDYVIFAIWVVSSLIFGILSAKANYYTFEPKCIVHHRFKKIVELPYSDIYYVDEKWSLKHKTVLLFTSRGQERYLSFDKEGVLYHNIMKNSHNLMSKEEYKIKFPHAKV